MAEVTLEFSRSLDSFWWIATREDMKENFRAMCVLDEAYDWEKPLEEIAEDTAAAADMSLSALAESLCMNQDDVSGPRLYGLQVSGPTVGDASQVQQTEVQQLRVQQGENECVAYWDDSDAYRYTATIEVEDAFEFAKLQVEVHPTFTGEKVILGVRYDGESIDLEQEEVGSFQPSSGFSF